MLASNCSMKVGNGLPSCWASVSKSAPNTRGADIWSQNRVSSIDQSRTSNGQAVVCSTTQLREQISRQVNDTCRLKFDFSALNSGGLFAVTWHECKVEAQTTSFVFAPSPNEAEFCNKVSLCTHYTLRWNYHQWQQRVEDRQQCP